MFGFRDYQEELAKSGIQADSPEGLALKKQLDNYNGTLAGSYGQAASAVVGAAIQAKARQQELAHQRMLERNAILEHFGDQQANTLMRGGANAFQKNAGESDAISTILGHILRR